MDKTEYKFPDEQEKASKKGDDDSEIKIEIEGDGETEVEIVDDTPKSTKKMEEPPKDMDEEELSQYGEKVRRRIQHLQKGYHEEKRRTEQAYKEREEAIRVAQTIVEENKKLKGSLNQGQNALLEQAKKSVASEMEDARRKYKEAYESGDSEALVNAQENMTAAKMKLDRVNNFKPTPLQEDETPVTIPQVSNQASDPKAEKWREKNQWFGPDDEMTSFALGLHNKLVKNGVDPSSDEYYDKVDSRMRQVFPEAFDSEEPAGKPEKEERRTKSNVVAPATRSSSPKKVVLTQTQVNIAKRLGVPLELYARKVAEQMRT
jgi:hypothetical protein